MRQDNVRVRKSDLTREAILNAGRASFARKGFSGSSIRDITTLAEVTRGNFYYYFPDKQSLFIELGTVTYKEGMTIAESFGDGVPVREWVVRYFEYLDRHGAFVIRSVEDAPADPSFRRSVAKLQRRTAAALGDRMAKDALRPFRSSSASIGMTTMAMLERSWLLMHSTDAPVASDDVTVDAVAELIERMLGVE
ncbi:TetR/AcrR family transcriptional regulator [Williamsia sp. DF01-3]|uniref:TetR/AcrR family transcriptional regulator n=1 Tax=Williamsia sp. DF01-3 TaxID=2934157 RepID=UPI001FF43021|nr:TetR/AcrR family transcriptional regulator [Williamsia sp. DF01-3]MCK0516708.1 TetR/AcrR family transcriptional regulator [Williamsia sp. DF01-3]